MHNYSQAKPYISHSDLYRQKKLMFHFVFKTCDYNLKI